MYPRVGPCRITVLYILASCAGLSVLYFVGPPSFSGEELSASKGMAQASLARLKALSPAQQRRAAAVLGALVTDAASESADTNIAL